MSWVLWLVAGAVALVAAFRGPPAWRADWLALAFVMTYLALRELDFQKDFTTWNLAHIPSYFDSAIPLHQRLIAFFGYRLPPPLACLWLLWRWGGAWLRALRTRERWALGLVAWFAMGGICALVDKLPHVVPFLMTHRWIGNNIEEWLEAIFALYGLLLVAWAFSRAMALSRAAIAAGQPVPAWARGGTSGGRV